MTKLTDLITPVYADATDNNLNYGRLKIEDVKQPLQGDLLTKFEKLRKRNEKVDDLWTLRVDHKEGDRSDRDFTLAKELKGEGFSLAEAAIILWNYPHGKVQSVKYPVREIIRCYDRSGNDFSDPIDHEHLAKIERQTNPIALKKSLSLANKNSSGLVFAGETDIKSTAKPILKKLIDEESVNMVFGPPNSGKSFLTLSMGASVAAGRDWGHYKLKQRHGVLIVCAEAGQSYAKRVLAAMRHLGYDHMPSPQELPLGYMTEYVNLREDDKSVKLILDRIKELEDRSGINCGMVIIDTLSASFGGGDENSSKDAKQYIDNMKKIKHLGKTAPVIVHHTGKDEAAGARGHSSFLGDMDTHLRVTAKKYGPRWERKLVPEKVRDADKNHELKFGLNVMEVGKDEDGDAIDTCHVIFETDSEFSDVSASPVDTLPQNQKFAYLALKIYNEMILSGEFSGHDILMKPEKTAKKTIFHILKNHENASKIKNESQGLDAIKGYCIADIDDQLLKSSGNMMQEACKELANKNMTEKDDVYQLVE
jgi:archaellum biogenesis ATPase FlaH